ncbi:MAG: CopD family protein [Crocinitomicaceae bacterium]|nr:CopD family protein [Crocinitomicaceae bacterium]
MDFSTIKALHIIFVVSWFAGLFYIVRLFIYHTEAQDKEENEKRILSNQFEIMESRLWWIITTPAMVLTFVFGTWMVILNWEYYLSAPWMQLKFAFVGVLLIYHFICQKILFDLKKGLYKWKSNGLRLWNELATLCLVAIVFLVVLKDGLNWIKGTVGFFAVAIGLMVLIKLYKRIRSRSNNSST